MPSVFKNIVRFQVDREPSPDEFLTNDQIVIEVFRLTEWLMSRKHCIRQWSPTIVRIQNPMKELVQSDDCPEEIRLLFQNEGYNLFTIKKANILINQKGRYENEYSGEIIEFVRNKFNNLLNIYLHCELGLADAAAQLVVCMMSTLDENRKLRAKIFENIKNCEKIFEEKNQLVKNLQYNFDFRCLKIGGNIELEASHYYLDNYRYSLQDSIWLFLYKFKNINDAAGIYIGQTKKRKSELFYLRFFISIVQFSRGLNPQFKDLYLSQYKEAPLINYETQIIPVDIPEMVDNDEFIKRWNFRQYILYDLKILHAFLNKKRDVLLNTFPDYLESKFYDEIEHPTIRELEEWLDDIDYIEPRIRKNSAEILILMETNNIIRYRIEYELSCIKDQHLSILKSFSSATFMYKNLFTKLKENQDEFIKELKKAKILWDGVEAAISKIYQNRSVKLCAESYKYFSEFNIT